MRTSFPSLCLAVLCAGCSAGQSPVHYDPQAARSNIVASLPKDWSAMSPSEWQKRVFGDYFTHPQTDAFLLLGPVSHYIQWKDKKGVTHHDSLAKECLYVWIVPSDFKPPFPPWWTDHPPLPERVYVSKGVRVYGFESHHIADTNRFDAIIEEATETSWPPVQFSWTSWRRDIAASQKK
jgi:hypothetical protein